MWSITGRDFRRVARGEADVEDLVISTTVGACGSEEAVLDDVVVSDKDDKEVDTLLLGLAGGIVTTLCSLVCGSAGLEGSEFPPIVTDVGLTRFFDVGERERVILVVMWLL